VLEATFRGAVVYKHHGNQFTGSGRPDTSITWAGPTSWIEFKVLDVRESIHAQLDQLQLTECIRLQHQCNRAWIVAFRKGDVRRRIRERIEFYLPTALKKRPGNEEPVPQLPLDYSCKHETILRDLRTFGVASFDGHDYTALCALIQQTHG
jgi:hypothetical protein